MKTLPGLMEAVLTLDNISSHHKQDHRPTDKMSEHYSVAFGPRQLQFALPIPVPAIFAYKADLWLLAAMSLNEYRRREDIP